MDPSTLSTGLRAARSGRGSPPIARSSEAQFLDHDWQAKNSITKIGKLIATIQGLMTAEFIKDIEMGMKRAPMSVRVSPYLVGLIDWANPYADPIRTQFFPLASRSSARPPAAPARFAPRAGRRARPRAHAPLRDKALFLPLDQCPVYCRFCTRSYAIGLDTEEVEKVHLRASDERWQRAFRYIESRPELEDIVISGGDAYQLRAHAAHGDRRGALLAMPNIRRMRFATKGPAVMPQKILTDEAWVDALTKIVEKGRSLHKEVVLHTHFNHPNEITGITEDAMNKLMERGIVVRNQSVLQRGVNDSPETMTLLVKRLGHVNVHPYYVYVHDLVKGVEDLRTSVDTALHIEKNVRGSTAGFNTPTFVVDAPGGGGKRDAHSYEYYDRETGVSVYAAPRVKPGKLFLYFDPLHQLSTHPAALGRGDERQPMIDDAIAKARAAGADRR